VRAPEPERATDNTTVQTDDEEGPMDHSRTHDQENQHVPATAREADAPTDEDYDHTGHERKEERPGGNRGGGDPNSALGR
jgi:hypothetical protein